jgi:hypothetical protein
MDVKKIIKENPGINLTINAGDLMEFGQSIASLTAQTVLNNHDEKVFTRNEVIEKFNICSATLWRWDKLGLIQGKKIGNRRYYSESEIKRLTSQKGAAK